MFIIDGYNLLWAVHKIDQEYGELADVQLCRIVGRYLKTIGEKGEIIFDGTGPRDKSEFDNTADVEVLFVGAGTDADTVIEEKIKANTAPKRLTVVSTDRRLRRAARTRRAAAIKSEDFWREVCKQLSRKNRGKKREPGEKQWGLSTGETEQWMKFFGLEE